MSGSCLSIDLRRVVLFSIVLIVNRIPCKFSLGRRLISCALFLVQEYKALDQTREWAILAKRLPCNGV